VAIARTLRKVLEAAAVSLTAFDGARG